MKRRDFIKQTSLATMAAATGIAQTSHAATERAGATPDGPPNIIVFLSDQQRWDTVGCYGQELPMTPHLDAMAAEGVRFESTFTCQPVCGPARSCLQTGKAGKVVDELVSLIDVAPTIMNTAGLEPLETMRGRPLQRLADGPVDDWADDWPKEIFAQISESHVGRAIRTKRWKYAVSAPDKSGGRDSASDRYEECFLYDLDADPHERNNLVSAADHVDIRRQLAATLKRRMVEAGEAEPIIDPA